MNCISCNKDLELKGQKFVYMRDMSTDNLRQVQITGRVPFDPTPEPVRFGPFCNRCQSRKLADMRRNYAQTQGEQP